MNSEDQDNIPVIGDPGLQDVPKQGHQRVRGSDRRRAVDNINQVASEVVIRENLIVAREIAAQIRESALRIREGEMRGTEAKRNLSDDNMLLLQQVNGRLVYATIEAQKLTDQLEKAKIMAETANRAKSDFLSGMSHELRTPLNAILGFAQLLEIGMPPPTAAQSERLHQITKAGWYLLELINEILDLAVVESGKLSLTQEPVSLIDVMRECEAMIAPQAHKHAVRIKFHSCDETWRVTADRTRVKQVLINLLTNAIKYNREHGKVEVTCTQHTQGYLRMSISDTGMGLSPEKLPLLFQPFNRLGQETGGEEGTGIGLVVSKHLVEMMGGHIGVTSTVGVGSEFWVELRRDHTSCLAPEQTLPAKPASLVQCDAAPCTLLYVENHLSDLLLIEQIIAAHPPMRMLSARDGQQGIALARDHLPQIIVMDIHLPDINGFEVLEILRNTATTRHTPVIALSTNAMARDIRKGLDAGFFRYLTKPIKINEVIRALDDALKLSIADKAINHESGKNT